MWVLGVTISIGVHGLVNRTSQLADVEQQAEIVKFHSTHVKQELKTLKATTRGANRYRVRAADSDNNGVMRAVGLDFDSSDNDVSESPRELRPTPPTP